MLPGIAVYAVVVLFGARAIGQDMVSRGVGGRHGWRYALPFLVAPVFMCVIWMIEQHRFPRLAPA